MASCFVLRFSRKAKLAQKVLRVDPTMVSLPLDARRTKWPWSFDRFACLTCSFAPARRLSRETHCWHRQGQKQTPSPDCQACSRSTPVGPNAFPIRWNMFLCDACRSKHASYVLECTLARSRCLASLRYIDQIGALNETSPASNK